MFDGDRQWVKRRIGRRLSRPGRPTKAAISNVMPATLRGPMHPTNLHPTHDRALSRRLIGIYLLTAVLMVGYGAVFSLLAEIRGAFGFSETAVGLIGGAAFAAGFVAQIALSSLADRGHGGQLLRVGMALAFASMVWMVVAETLTEWLGARALLGFGAGCVRPAVRRFAIIADPARAGAAIGTLAAFETAGFLIGPVLASLMFTFWGLRSTFIVLAVLIAALSPVVVRARIPGAEQPRQYAMWRLLAKPAMQSSLATGIAFYIAVGVFEAIWAVFMDDLGASQVFIGVTMSVFALPMVFISPRAGAWAQRTGTLTITTGGMAIAIVCMLIYGWVASPWLLCIPLAIHAIADACTMPANQLAVGYASGDDALAAGQGLFGATGMVVATLAAVGSGALYQYAGPAGLWTTSAVVMAVCIAFAWLRGAALRAPQASVRASGS